MCWTRSTQEPAAAFRRVGLNPFRAEEAATSWNELRTIRRLHLLLAPHGLAYLAKRISDEYPNTAHRVITENPYELTRVFGVGFKVADRIARAHAESVEAIPGRVSAALVYALSEAEGRGGSTCLPVGQLLARRARSAGRAAGRGGGRRSWSRMATCARRRLDLPHADLGARAGAERARARDDARDAAAVEAS